MEEKEQLYQMIEAYDLKYAMSVQLQDEVNGLKAMQASIAHGMSKEKIMGALKEKARNAEDVSKQTVHAYIDQQIDDRAMMRQYINARKEYHATEILKVKIA